MQQQLQLQQQEVGIFSIDRIVLTHAGIGYTTAPQVTITGGGGVGANRNVLLKKQTLVFIDFIMTNNGVGYTQQLQLLLSLVLIQHQQLQKTRSSCRSGQYLISF